MPRRSNTSTTLRRRSSRSSSAILLALLAGLLASPTRADDDEKPPDDGGSVVVIEEPPVTPLEAGDPAPFPGLLFTVQRAVNLGNKVERCEFERKQEGELAKKRLEIETAGSKAAAEIRVEGAEARAQAAVDALEQYKKDNEREVWDQPGLIFWTGVAAGIVTTGVLAVGAVLTVGYLRPALPPAEANVSPAQ